MKEKFSFKAGLSGIGLEAYWEQFEGLEKRLQNYIRFAKQQMKTKIWIDFHFCFVLANALQKEYRLQIFTSIKNDH